MAGAANHVELLLAREVDELHGVAGDADGEVGVLGLFWMLHRVDELLGAEHVHVEMVRALGDLPLNVFGVKVVIDGKMPRNGVPSLSRPTGLQVIYFRST